MVRIDGRVVIEARDSLTGELKDYRDINNLVYDVYRMRYFFPWQGGSYTNYTPIIGFGGSYTYLYLSEYSGTIDQSSYSSMTRYATSSSAITPTTTTIQRFVEILKTYPVVSFGGQSPTRTLRCAGLLFSYYSDVFYISAVTVDPPITHDSVTTLYVHYYLRLYLDSNDPLFGNEVLQRSGGASYQVGIPGYKKQFYIAPIAVKALESSDIPNEPRLFKYADDSSYYSKKGSISIPQSWCGPVGGVYEMRNSSLGAGCMYDPHISRIFAHKSSEVHSIFYDSTETDIPESEGTLTLDISSNTLEFPEVYQLNFVTTGDVGTATYNVREYMCPTGNELYYGGAAFDLRGTASDGSYNYFKNRIYISGNGEWRTSKNASTVRDEISYGFNYVCIGYKQFDRDYFKTTDQYCIRNDGLLYYTAGGTSTTSGKIVTSGSATLVTQADLPIAVGNRCRFRDSYSARNNWMEGTVTSYVGTSLTINVDSYSDPSGDTVVSWWIVRCSTVIKSADMGSTDVTPTENTEFDVATVLSGHGITQILGLCIDEDEGYLWIATNVGFARATILTEYSGGNRDLPYVTPYDFAFFDHNTVGFGSYMSSVNNVIIFDPWNGRFTAEQGTLTWIQKSDSRIIWHWTGDRDARSVTVDNYGVANLFLQLDMDYIVVVRNSGYSADYPCYNGTCYVSVLRIGNSTEGLVITYNYNTDIGHYIDYPGYACCVAGKQFWYMGVSYGSSQPSRKGKIDLTTMTHSIVNSGTTTYRPGNSLMTYTTIFCSASANRSMHPNFATFNVSSGYYNNSLALVLDSGPCYWGWDGSEWIIDTDYSHTKTTHGTSETLPNDIMISFQNGPGAVNSFRSGDYYTFGVNPNGLYKDNLQTITLYVSMYGYHSNVVTRTITVPSGSVYTIPEASTYPNFVSMAYWRYDPHAKVTFADTTVGTIVNAAPASTYEVRFNYDGTLTFYTGHVGESVEIRYVWLTKGLE